MKITRMASVPLIVQDPYISIWSSHDNLYDGATTHWCGKKQALNGYINVNGVTYCFMGDKEYYPVIEQSYVKVSATKTTYQFENDLVSLQIDFCSPFLLEEPLLISRPCTYIDFKVVPKKEIGPGTIWFTVSKDIVGMDVDSICGGVYSSKTFNYVVFGKSTQTPLNHSGDNLTIDWGNCYLASDDDNVEFAIDYDKKQISSIIKFGHTAAKANLIFAYDDLAAVNYFGDFKKAYWTTVYPSILEAVKAAIEERDKLLERCRLLDREIEEETAELIGTEYSFLCIAAYRQSIAAHKLIADNEGNLIFLSKENNSNGCIGTVDVSYPSVPLYLLKNTDYVKGMLRPVFKFAESKVWEFDFAPHDVGRYPYAVGQVYGLNPEHADKSYKYDDKSVFPFFYMFPRGTGIYGLENQMPVEECGNMIIMTAAVCQVDGNGDFARPHMELLEKWAAYLVQYGEDPGEQLCTDDFAGHLSHNTNLSVKAILGIEAYALLCRKCCDEDKYVKYHTTAKAMAKSWEKRAAAGDHTKLTFDNDDSWSLKYNLVWDVFFHTNLFSAGVYEKETAYYISKNGSYGVPLDSREMYTKSDWILWCASLCKNQKQMTELVSPVAKYVRETSSRVPFSDWYDTETGVYTAFIARSVQGGIFMPLLIDKYKAE